MMMNIRGGIANVTLGETQILGEAFAKEYGITLDIENVETDEYEPGIIIYQSRGIGDRIVQGITLRIKVAKEKSEPIEDLLPSDDNNGSDDTTDEGDNTNN